MYIDCHQQAGQLGMIEIKLRTSNIIYKFRFVYAIKCYEYKRKHKYVCLYYKSNMPLLGWNIIITISKASEVTDAANSSMIELRNYL